MPGKRMTKDQRTQAVEWVADGKPYSFVARQYGKDVRTIERQFCPCAPLRLAVERLVRQRELAAHHAASKRAGHHHLPIPLHPDAARAETRAMHEALAALPTPGLEDRVIGADEERRIAPPRLRNGQHVFPAPNTDAAICMWILSQHELASESDWLDARDAEHGVVSVRARRRYMGQGHRRRQILSV